MEQFLSGSFGFSCQAAPAHVATERSWPGSPHGWGRFFLSGIFLERTWHRRIIRRVNAQRHNSPKLAPARPPRWGFLAFHRPSLKPSPEL